MMVVRKAQHGYSLYNDLYAGGCLVIGDMGCIIFPHIFHLIIIYIVHSDE
jgi:hypothetical protein